MNRFLAFLAALLLAAPVLAKGDFKAANAPLAPPTLSIINGNPLRINVASDNSYQIFNSNVGSSGQIYPSNQTTTADMGWFVDINGTLYSPNFGEHGGTATGGLGTYIPFGEISMSPVSGSGTPASPYTVTVSVNLGDSGFRATKTTSYINGNGYFTERFRVVNIGGNTADVSIFLGSDIFLASSDSGRPFLEPTSTSPGGRTCSGIVPEYTILHIPLTPARRYTAAFYSSVWSQIGNGLLDNAVNASPCIDNGAALQWTKNVPPLSSFTVLAATSFGEVPDITQFNITDVNPSQGVIGTTVPVTISGYGFLPATTFNFGAGITVSNVQILNGNTATATLTIADTAMLGFRDVIATQQPGGLVATLVDGFAVVEPPVWNYSINGLNTVNPQAVACVRSKFPFNPSTNAEGWAPTEGEWFAANPINPNILLPPTGLARAILDCYLNPAVWNSQSGYLHDRYCWLDPAPWYQGSYPDIRVAQLKLYDAVNSVCLGPQPGWPIYESEVPMTRTLFYPLALPRNGFEEP